jgi:hypothetical protein
MQKYIQYKKFYLNQLGGNRCENCGKSTIDDGSGDICTCPKVTDATPRQPSPHSPSAAVAMPRQPSPSRSSSSPRLPSASVSAASAPSSATSLSLDAARVPEKHHDRLYRLRRLQEHKELYARKPTEPRDIRLWIEWATRVNSFMEDSEDRTREIEKLEVPRRDDDQFSPFTYICDADYTALYTNTITEPADQNRLMKITKVTFDTGNSSDTMVSEDIIEDLQLFKFPIIATNQQISGFNSLLTMIGLERFMIRPIKEVVSPLTAEEKTYDRVFQEQIMEQKMLNRKYPDIPIEYLYLFLTSPTNIIAQLLSGSIGVRREDANDFMFSIAGIRRSIGVGGATTMQFDYVNIPFHILGTEVKNAPAIKQFFNVKCSIDTQSKGLGLLFGQSELLHLHNKHIVIGFNDLSIARREKINGLTHDIKFYRSGIDHARLLQSKSHLTADERKMLFTFRDYGRQYDMKCRQRDELSQQNLQARKIKTVSYINERVTQPVTVRRETLPPQEWACPVCTFLNPPDTKLCNICGTKKP